MTDIQSNNESTRRYSPNPGQVLELAHAVLGVSNDLWETQFGLSADKWGKAALNSRLSKVYKQLSIIGMLLEEDFIESYEELYGLPNFHVDFSSYEGLNKSWSSLKAQEEQIQDWLNKSNPTDGDLPF